MPVHARHILILLTALVLAGCAGDDGGGDRLTKAALKTRVTAICDRFFARLEQLPEARRPSDLGKVGRAAQPAYEDAVAELRELEPPEEYERYDDWIDKLSEQGDVWGEVVAAADANDVGRLQELFRAAREREAEVYGLALGLGFQRCVEQ